VSVLDWHRRKTHDGKIPFATEREAELAVESLRSAGRAHSWELRVYRCWYCRRSWHFGHPRRVRRLRAVAPAVQRAG